VTFGDGDLAVGLHDFELLGDIIPEPKPGGRNREVDIRSVLIAIFYLKIEFPDII
jgi:hypothetical protein